MANPFKKFVRKISSGAKGLAKDVKSGAKGLAKDVKSGAKGFKRDFVDSGALAGALSAVAPIASAVPGLGTALGVASTALGALASPGAGGAYVEEAAAAPAAMSDLATVTASPALSLEVATVPGAIHSIMPVSTPSGGGVSPAVLLGGAALAFALILARLQRGARLSSFALEAGRGVKKWLVKEISLENRLIRSVLKKTRKAF